MSDQDLLDCLLDLNEELEQSDEVKDDKKPKASNIHSGDTDSSDDEDNRDFQSSKYNDFGKSIKQILTTSENREEYDKPQRVLQPASWKTKPVDNNTAKSAAVNKVNGTKLPEDVYTDPVFGMRIVNPVISHAMLKERMQGREAVSMAKVRMFVERLTPQTDWVIAGVLVSKMGRTSQKGNAFAIWTLSDLHGDLKTITLFLFGSAYKELAKCMSGTVVGVLNPSVFEKKKDSKDEACLSVDNYQRVMIFGQSKDLGTCKSIKKNGDRCTMFVNKNRCEFCLFHIKQEYQKCSKRSELQSNFQGKGLTALRNKVLGKNEVFYAGKSYTAIPAKRSTKLTKQDDGRLSLLSGRVSTSSNNIVKAKSSVAARRKQAENVEMFASQRLKDLERLKRLVGGSKDVEEVGKSDQNNEGFKTISAEESKTNALAVIAKLKARTTEQKTAKNQSNSVMNDSNEIDHSKVSREQLKITEEENSSVEEKKKGTLAEIVGLKAKSALDLKSKNAVESPSTQNKPNSGSLNEVESIDLNIDYSKHKDKANDIQTLKTFDMFKNTKGVEISKTGNSESENVKAESSSNGKLNNIDGNSRMFGAESLLNGKLNNIDGNSRKFGAEISSNAELNNIDGNSKECGDVNSGEKIDYANILDENNLSDIEFNSSDDDLNNWGKNDKAKVSKNTTLSGGKSPNHSVNKNKIEDEKKNDKSKLSKNATLTEGKSANNLLKNATLSQGKSTNNLLKNATLSEGNSTNKLLKNTTPSERKSAKHPVNKNKIDDVKKTDKSNGISPNENAAISNSAPLNVNQRLPDLKSVPCLLNSSNSVIDLNVSYPKRVDRAKCSALEWVKKNGPIKKDDGKNKRKRAFDITTKIETDNDPKRRKIQENEFFSERFKKMMSATSKHTNLIAQRDDEEQEKYFGKLEMKERMEDKMMSTYKIDCKAVRCLQCKYTSFSAADSCKQQRHPLKVFDAVKRFFKCGDCGYRTVTLKIIPVESCKHCGSGKWERTTMMKEKKVDKMHSLSIRGGEQAHTNSVITNGNVNLLVPDE